MSKKQQHSVAVIIVVIGAVVLSQRSSWEQHKHRYVIIHSDDAGMCPAVNQATIDAMENGSVSSCSIMVPCPGFEDFAEYARTHPEYDYGIHLTLTSEMQGFRWGPVLPIDEVPSLVLKDGKFWRTSAGVGDSASLDDAERELRAQINRALECGIAISHLDNHMFSLFSRPDLLRLYVKLGREYDLPIRIQRKPHPDDVDLANEELVREYYSALESLFSNGDPVFEVCLADNYDLLPSEKRAHFLEVLRNLQPGVSEILIHCSYDWDSPTLPPHANSREADTRVFSSLEVASEIDRLGIKLIDWKEFRALRSEHRFGI